jgi:hypothetical protein
VPCSSTRAHAITAGAVRRQRQRERGQTATFVPSFLPSFTLLWETATLLQLDMTERHGVAVAGGDDTTPLEIMTMARLSERKLYAALLATAQAKVVAQSVPPCGVPLLPIPHRHCPPLSDPLRCHPSWPTGQLPRARRHGDTAA